MRIAIFGLSGKMGRAVSKLVSEVFPIDQADVFLDFSVANAVEEHIQIAKSRKKPIVIGVTGLTPTTYQAIEKAGKEIPILYSPNFSIGIALFHRFSKELSKLENFTLNITEEHHIHKKDAPSGTALSLAKALVPLQATIETIRQGDTTGKHTLHFDSDAESITLSHIAHSKDAFAKGALMAAKFLLGKIPGIYTLEQVL